MAFFTEPLAGRALELHLSSRDQRWETRVSTRARLAAAGNHALAAVAAAQQAPGSTRAR